MTATKQNESEPRRRPFPWMCSSCKKHDVYPAHVPYMVDIKHDGRLHTVHLPDLETPQCRSCGELFISDDADDKINDALRSQLRLLMPAQIRNRRKDLRLKQGELAEKLGVAEETISRWETGAMIQSRPMDNLLRLYFGVPEVRAVLRGTEQDPLLGTGAIRESGPQNPQFGTDVVTR